MAAIEDLPDLVEGKLEDDDHAGMALCRSLMHQPLYKPH